MQSTILGQLTFVPTEQPSGTPAVRMPEYEQFDDVPLGEPSECSPAIDKTLMRTLHGIKDAQLGLEFRDFVSVRRGLKFAMNSIEYVERELRADKVNGITTPASVRIDDCLLQIQELKRKILVSNVLSCTLKRNTLLPMLQKGLLSELSQSLGQAETMLGSLSDKISDELSYSWV